MRKLFSLFAAMLVALAVNATVIQITPTSPHSSDNLRQAIASAATGDIIEMATGTYEESTSDYLAFHGKEVVVRAAEGANVIVKTAVPIRLKTGGRAEFDGIKFDCENLTGYSNLIVSADDTENKRVVLNDCEFYNWTKNSALIQSTSSRRLDSIVINNCYFHNCEKSMVFVENANLVGLEIKNSTFANITATVTDSYYAAPIYVKATTGKVLVDHCTFYNVATMSLSYGVVSVDAIADATVSNCIFMLPATVDRCATNLKAGGDVKNTLTYNYDNWQPYGHYNTATVTACVKADPLFVNAAEANYTLGEGSPALTMNDGEPIGDPRWVPAVAPAEPQTLYLKPGVWNTASAKFAIWDITHSAWSEFMTLAENETDIYTATVPADAAKVIFVRLNSDATAPDWDKKWNQTEDLDLVVDNDLFTITAWGSEKSPGAWSKYAPAVGCDWANIAWVDGSNSKLKVCKNGEVPGVVNIQQPSWADESGIYMTFPSAAWDKTKFSLPAGTYATEGAGMVIYLSALDMKFNEISINCNNTDYAFTVYNADGADVVYNVAGEPETVFGSTWNTYANKMTLEEGIYKLEKTGLELAAGTIAFKVVKNHAWAAGAWPTDNYVLNVAESGIYTISITFNESTKEINATATKTGEAVVLPVVTLHGNFSGEWAGSDAFAEATDKKTSSLTMTLAKGNYEFGMKFGGVWTANGVAFTRANPSAAVTSGTGNLTLAADVAGDYTFTWTYETNTLSIAYPVKYYEYATGHLNKADFADVNARILLTLSKSGNDIVVTVKNNAAAGNTKEGLNYLWVSAAGATTVTYGSHDTENTETVSVKVKFDAPQASYKFNNIHWAYAGMAGEWAIDDLTVQASQICELEDGYYLVGKFGGVEAWDLDDLSAEKRFEANPGTDGEYMLTATLAENDNLKVVKVINDAYGPWYPATDPNYVVGADYVGVKTIYFRPNGDGGEGWHYGYIYIAPSIPTAIDNADAELKATKRIENGQLFIELNGVRYNVIGAKVR